MAAASHKHKIKKHPVACQQKQSIKKIHHKNHHQIKKINSLSSYHQPVFKHRCRIVKINYHRTNSLSPMHRVVQPPKQVKFSKKIMSPDVQVINLPGESTLVSHDSYTSSLQSKRFWETPVLNLDVFLSGGAVVTRATNQESVQINNTVINNYQAQAARQVSPMLGLGVSNMFRNLGDQPIDLSAGLTLYYAHLGNVKGTEFPFANDGSFDTLNYQFNIKTTTLLAESRLYSTYFDWQPYALVGLGAAWNEASNYSEVPSNPALGGAPAPQVFSNHTTANFAYEFGVGVQHQVAQDCVNHIRYFAALDYRYLNLGKAQLGSFPAQSVGSGLTVDNLYTQGIIFTVRAAFY